MRDNMIFVRYEATPGKLHIVRVPEGVCLEDGQLVETTGGRAVTVGHNIPVTETASQKWVTGVYTLRPLRAEEAEAPEETETTYVPMACLECAYSQLRQRKGVEPCVSCPLGPEGMRG